MLATRPWPACASIDEGSTRGRHAAGTPNRSSMASSHWAVRRLSSSVRLALVTSVTWARPAVSFQASQLSMVPKHSSPRSARARAPGTWSSSQASLVAEKYGSSSRPVCSVTRSSWPAARSASQRSAVRRSCQTIAGATGWPVARSHSTTVSRWLVMPTAARSRGAASARASTSAMVTACDTQISLASCSTQPGCGKNWVNSRCALATMLPSRSNRIERELVVPWSSASTKRDIVIRLLWVAADPAPQRYSWSGLSASQTVSLAAACGPRCKPSLLRRQRMSSAVAAHSSRRK